MMLGVKIKDNQSICPLKRNICRRMEFPSLGRRRGFVLPSTLPGAKPNSPCHREPCRHLATALHSHPGAELSCVWDKQPPKQRGWILANPQRTLAEIPAQDSSSSRAAFLVQSVCTNMAFLTYLSRECAPCRHMLNASWLLCYSARSHGCWQCGAEPHALW